LDFFDPLFRDQAEIGRFGEILANEAIRVFIGSSLLSRIGPGEEDWGLHLKRRFFMLGELQSVIVRDRSDSLVLE
jgi:hypothetical protein